MRLLPMILTAIMGWILWRIIRVFVRTEGSSRREGRAEVDPATSSGQTSSAPRRTILEAEFEDITPSQPRSEEPEKPQA